MYARLLESSSRKIWLMDEDVVKNQTKVWLTFLEAQQHQEKCGANFSRFWNNKQGVRYVFRE